MSTITKPRIASGDLEIRLMSTSTMECRTAGDVLTFRGLAASVESPYDMSYYTETIKRGAFDKTLASGPDVQLLVNHEGLPIARTTNGSLRLSDVGNGLEFTATASASDPDAAAVATKVKAGLMDQCSFAFRVVDQNWNDDRTQRDITEVSMDRGDVSIVNYGANPNTSVVARARLNGRRAPHSLYVARARALALRGRDLRIKNDAGRR